MHGKKRYVPQLERHKNNTKEDNLNNIAIDAGKCITVRCQVELPNINQNTYQ